MLPRLFVSAAALSLVALPVLADDHVYEFSNFRQIEVSDGIKLVVISGADSYRVEAAFNSLPGGTAPRISQDGQVLDIQRNTRLSPITKLFEDELRVTVHMPGLSGLTVGQGATAHVSGTISGNVAFTVTQGGAMEASGLAARKVALTAAMGAELEIGGSCEVLSVEASDGADVDAEGLRCRSVEVSAMRGADVEVTATESLRASAALGGAVSVAGHPSKTEVAASIGGSVQIAD
ncbi:DUF2807 domain-containing protein [Phaeobacter sp. HF9A]|uniref:GIN domain-containing protein n=1 Tax=Phaeobacter sp. HF9A TaxID=2721561 RepID=UPI0014308C94|nr:DUF2807 domain-containing protein [Phaeobacter sp. HF9A]NIZ13528.1 DUF2807 domain-containing protein [Phaeobacter sp. HF9A]